MALYARVEAGEIAEFREIDEIPAHKAALWRPVVIEGSGPAETVVIEADRVRKVRGEVNLAPLKAYLRSKVAEDAEACRLRYITPGAGQAMTYLEKHNQANAVHDMGQSAANALTETEYRSLFPTLAASVGVEAATLWDAAELVISRYEAWATLSFMIERARLAGSRAISDASDAAAARAAYEAITWPNP